VVLEQENRTSGAKEKMKIVKAYAKMMAVYNARDEINDFTEAHGRRLLQYIEWCGRISHRSEDKMTDTSYDRFIRAVVLGHGDWSIVEHTMVSVDAIVDRGITHEWVRHRIGAYTQESTRFVNYEKHMPPAFIYPQPLAQCNHCHQASQSQCEEFEAKYEDDNWIHDAGDDVYLCTNDPDWMDAIQTAETKYKALLAKKWRPQEARSVFPNALASRLITTYNLRNWRHFFLMRTSAEAHPQMREVTIPLLKEFQEKIPILFEDIEPNQKQSDNMKKMR
jgi:thymidylate synthase (FAD)